MVGAARALNVTYGIIMQSDTHDDRPLRNSDS